MRHSSKLERSTPDYGLELSQTENREILAQSISKERNTLIAEKFISDIVEVYGNIQCQQMVVLGIHKHASF
jgi:hypothetical protein